MNRPRIVGPLAVAAGVAGVFGVVALGAAASETPSGSPTHAADPAVDQPPAQAADAAVTSGACDANAVVDLEALPAEAREGAAELRSENRRYQVVSSHSSVADAERLSRTISTDRERAAAARVESVSGPYAWLGVEDQLMPAQRCVWYVTVEAPFAPRSGPAPVGDAAPIRPADSYTAVYDLASGEYLGVTAGTESLNVITGAGFPGASSTGTDLTD